MPPLWRRVFLRVVRRFGMMIGMRSHTRLSLIYRRLRRFSFLPVNAVRFIGRNRSPLLCGSPLVAMSSGRIPPF